MPFVWTGIGTAAVALGALFLGLRRAARERKLLDRLASGFRVEAPPAELPEPIPQVELKGFAALVNRALRRAGLSMRVPDFMLLCLSVGLTAGYLATEFHLPLWVVPLLVAAAGYAPLAAIRSWGDRRIRKLETQMADAMDLMAAGFQSGAGVRECLNLIRSQNRKPISAEFQELFSLIEVGVPPAAAFKQWSKPLGSKIVTVFALAMAAKWDIGGNYTLMLANLSGRIRDLIRLQRRVRTLTAEAMFTGLLAMTLPYAIALMAVTLNPGHLEPLWQSPIGPLALAFVMGLQALAVFTIRKMVKSIYKGT